jgi:hypothetical protein
VTPLDQFDPDNFRADGPLALPPRKRKARVRRGRWFIKGPLPGEWIGRASQLSGKALHVGLALWFISGRSKQEVVKLTRAALKLFSLRRDSARRGLAALERAGLVRVSRRRGRCPVVEILPYPANDC